MKVGIRLPQTGEHAKPENVIYLAKLADKSGFDSLWVLERLLWPISPQTLCPSTPTGNFPQDWQNVLEPLELLSFVSAITEKIYLGTSVYRDAFPQSSHIGKEICYVRCHIGWKSTCRSWFGLVEGRVLGFEYSF